jgi:hypothetical protein
MPCGLTSRRLAALVSVDSLSGVPGTTSDYLKVQALVGLVRRFYAGCCSRCGAYPCLVRPSSGTSGFRSRFPSWISHASAYPATPAINSASNGSLSAGGSRLAGPRERIAVPLETALVLAGRSARLDYTRHGLFLTHALSHCAGLPGPDQIFARLSPAPAGPAGHPPMRNRLPNQDDQAQGLW